MALSIWLVSLTVIIYTVEAIMYLRQNSYIVWISKHEWNTRLSKQKNEFEY